MRAERDSHTVKTEKAKRGADADGSNGSRVEPRRAARKFFVLKYIVSRIPVSGRSPVGRFSVPFSKVLQLGQASVAVSGEYIDMYVHMYM